MSTSVTVQTKDGRVVSGINYSVNAATLPSDLVALAAGMQGGMAYGMYHLRTTTGWQYIPASQIAAVLSVKAGVAI